MDPLNMSTEQQCGYILECVEAGVDPISILQIKFWDDKFTFDLLMSIIVERGWARKDKKSGRWHVKRKLDKLQEL
jgi:hypothetical protein